MTDTLNPIPSVIPARTRTGVPRPGAGVLRLRPTLRGRGFVVGAVDAAGPDTSGFAPRDRVAWRDDGRELPALLLMPQDDVLGVPSWISDEQVVSYLAPGLVARALVRTRPVGRGDAVQVLASDPLVHRMTSAWVKSLGARVTDDDATLEIRDLPQARRIGGGHGRLAQAAVEVFQAIRAGVFDGVEPISGTRPGLAA
ncbi:MAG: hypothetical protein J0G30_09690 [Actinomycetales bacterium]|nr:hypothetical protein [Actinomycetales bacterium]